MRLSLLTSLFVALFLAAGCGGDEESASEAWASDFCSAAADWRASLDGAIGQVQNPSDLTFDTVKGAIDDGLDATETFVDDVRALGPPETEAGQEAAEIVDSMASTLESDVDELRGELETESDSLPALLEKVSQATDLIGQMAQELQSSFQELQALEPAQELRTALDDNEECASARSGSR